MTTLKLFSVFDLKANLFAQPYVDQSNGNAIRNFATACEDEKTNLHKYPSDYHLYQVGTICILTGALTSDLKQIATASEFVNRPTQPTYDSLKADIDSIWKQLKINQTTSHINDTANKIQSLSN